MSVLQAEECNRSLQQKLAPIFIRRTGSSLFKNILPPRHLVTLSCPMTDIQRARYDDIAGQVLAGGWREDHIKADDIKAVKNDRDEPHSKYSSNYLSSTLIAKNTNSYSCPCCSQQSEGGKMVPVILDLEATCYRCYSSFVWCAHPDR